MSEDVEILSEWRLEFNDAWSSSSEQRDYCNEDIRFVTTPAAMWEGFLRDQFANRPRFQFDQISGHVDRVYGEWLTNRATVNYRPEVGGNEGDAKILNGLYRKDERRDDGQYAIDAAVLEALQGGYGAFKLATETIDEEENLQHVMFKPLVSAHAMVAFDPNSKRYDKSDARYCYILTEMSRSRAEDMWDTEITSFTTPFDRREFNWNGVRDSIFIAERYEVMEKRKKVFKYRNPLGKEVEYLEDELREEGVIDDLAEQGYEKTGEKRKWIRHVEKSVFSGNTMLEEPRKIPGKHIPVIPIYAYWTFTDGMEYYYGLVRKQKDPQRLLNMQISTLAEVAATSVKEVPIFTPQQIKGHERNWAQAHLGKKNYQLVNPLKDAQGNIIGAGAIDRVSPPNVDPALAALVDITSNQIQSTTGGVPQDVVDPDASGKAILAMQQRVDMGTASIMKNIQRSLKRCGEVYRSIAEDIYDTPRLVTLTGEDDIDFEEQLFKLTVDNETGELKEINDITQGKYEVIVSTGPAYSSMRQQTVEEIRELLTVLPEGSPYTAPLLAVLIENVDGTNIDAVKEFNKRLMLIQGIREPENEEEAALLQQIQSQNDQGDMTQVLLASAAQEQQASAREKETQSLRNLADARLKTAQAMKTEKEAGGQTIDNISKILQPIATIQ